MLGLVVLACAIVAIVQFTAAGSIVLESEYGNVQARLVIGAVYSAIGLLAVAWLWAMRGQPDTTDTRRSTLPHHREMQIIMLLEAAMLGYSLARKKNRVP